ncbi:pentapeptide repeat-containing protein [Spirillospora sp. NPDC046719]
MGGQQGGARRPARLIPVWAALAATFIAAVAITGTILWLGLHLLDVHGVKHEKQVTSSVLFDLVKLSFAFVAGLGGLVALVVAYRKQRTEENAALREDTKLHSDRFTAAVAQLGDASPAVQLGGVHALAGLADDAPTRQLRQTCIDVLCAYLRLPYEPDPDLREYGQSDAEYARARATFRAIREVRHTVIRVISSHLRNNATVSWQGYNLDFTDVVFDGGDFSNAVFNTTRVSFQGARFRPGTVGFRAAQFKRGTVDFSGAKFEGGLVDFTQAGFGVMSLNFRTSHFKSGTIIFRDTAFRGSQVTFADTEFEGATVDFQSSVFDCRIVDFRGAQFANGTVDFREARLMASTTFEDAKFEGGLVDFTQAEFGGIREFGGEYVSFRSAHFERGTATFRGTNFRGKVAFNDTKFDGATVDFREAMIGYRSVEFRGAQFAGGTVDFRGTQFQTSGSIHFDNAVFGDATVDFEGASMVGALLMFETATGRRPRGLPRSVANHLRSTPR